jgi:hypothetical protein
MNKIKQHSSLWYTIKSHYLGANDCASILGHGFDSIDEVIELKVQKNKVEKTFSTIQQARMDKGKFYESYVKREYEQRNSIKIHETGLKFHPRLKFLTASPDGYFNTNTGSKTLMEFKVLRNLSDGKIPYKYWIQMQIQMAVWNINNCLYCENVVTDDGKLLLWNEHLIKEDKVWFSSVEKKLLETWKKIEDLRSLNKRGQKRKAEVDLQRDLKIKLPAVLPYMITNYIRKDPLLDFLNKYGSDDDKDLNENGLLTLLKRQRDEFSSLLIKHYQDKYKDICYNVDFCGDISSSISSNANIQADQLKITSDSINRTRIAMQEQIPIILNACLSSDVFHKGAENPIGNTGGLINMLVLNSYLKEVLNVDSVDLTEKYSIVMFKYATMDLKVDGRTLLNNDKQRVYKAQINMLNDALSVEQNHIADCAYIIGRKYTWNACKVNSAVEHAAIINFDFKDEDYTNAISWLIKLHTDLTMKNLKPGTVQGFNDLHLLPNMKNQADYPWHSLKSKIANDIKEITLIYNCGHKIRDLAAKQGITDWEHLTPDLLKSNLSKAFLKAREVNDKDKPFLKPTVEIVSRKSNVKLRFYIDFESIGNVYDDFSTFPVAGNNAMIFLIGAIVENTETNEIKYLHYIADELRKESELKIINNMFEDFLKLMKEVDQTDMPLYHWSNAEKYLILNAIKTVPDNVVFIDLCKIFKDNMIIFPGQFNYGLKDVARVMKEENMIETTWHSSPISNGIEAMVQAVKFYKENENSAFKKEFFLNIVDYNYVDCKVMQEIVKWLKFKG